MSNNENSDIVGYPILSLQHLESLFKGRNDLDCYVRLKYGRSSKRIILEEDGQVNVINEIDDTSEVFNSLDDMCLHHSSISKAMKVNAFFVYAYEIRESDLIMYYKKE